MTKDLRCTNIVIYQTNIYKCLWISKKRKKDFFTVSAIVQSFFLSISDNNHFLMQEKEFVLTEK